MMERYSDVVTWYVVFDKYRGNKRYWWQKLLHKDFGHVYALSGDDKQTIMINPFYHALVATPYDMGVVEMVEHAIRANSTAILQYTVYYGASYKDMPLDIVTCVSTIKRLLSINTRLFTPKQLYHELIKAGAIAIKPFCIY